MLDFRPKKRSAAPLFSLNRADQVRQRGHQSQGIRRIWHGAFLLVMTGVIAWLLVDWIRSSPAQTVAGVAPVDAPLTPMPRPTLDGRPALPAADALAGEDVAAAVAAGEPPLWSSETDPVLLAWCQAMATRDTAAPPLPQAVSPRDLLRGHTRPGMALFISGRIDDSRAAPFPDGSPGWQRVLLRTAPDQYALVLAPPTSATLALGDEVQAVGRLVGHLRLHTANNPGTTTATEVEVPLIAARRLTAAGSIDTGERPFWREAFSLPADIYSYVDDERLILETRPYYHLLGQVLRDRYDAQVYATADDANQRADELHQTPAAFRGKPFHVHGTVFHAWEDDQVAHDRPFEVTRTARIILWSQDFSPITEGDPPQRVTKFVLRAFEIAALGDQPLPAPGTEIEATGRFLRMRAMEVKADPRREADSHYARQSDRSYTFLFVTDGWRAIPPPPAPSWQWYHSLILAAVLLFSTLVVWWVRRTARNDGLVQEQVRKLRQNRSTNRKPT
jgi:hypothetical protein